MPCDSLHTNHDTAAAFLEVAVPAAICDPRDPGMLRAIPKLTTGVEAQLAACHLYRVTRFVKAEQLAVADLDAWSAGIAGADHVQGEQRDAVVGWF